MQPGSHDRNCLRVPRKRASGELDSIESGAHFPLPSGCRHSRFGFFTAAGTHQCAVADLQCPPIVAKREYPTNRGIYREKNDTAYSRLLPGRRSLIPLDSSQRGGFPAFQVLFCFPVLRISSLLTPHASPVPCASAWLTDRPFADVPKSPLLFHRPSWKTGTRCACSTVLGTLT